MDEQHLETALPLVACNHNLTRWYELILAEYSETRQRPARVESLASVDVHLGWLAFLSIEEESSRLLLFAAFKDAPEELDVTIFDTASTTLPPVAQAAQLLVKKVDTILLYN